MHSVLLAIVYMMYSEEGKKDIEWSNGFEKLLIPFTCQKNVLAESRKNQYNMYIENTDVICM